MTGVGADSSATASGGRKPAELNSQKPGPHKRFPDRKKKPHGTHVPRSPTQFFLCLVGPASRRSSFFLPWRAAGVSPLRLPLRNPPPINGFQNVKRNLTGLTSRARLPNSFFVWWDRRPAGLLQTRRRSSFHSPHPASNRSSSLATRRTSSSTSGAGNPASPATTRPRVR